MAPEIPEFSYGFALTNEIVGWNGVSTAPIFPSLIEEGWSGGGYDVLLDKQVSCFIFNSNEPTAWFEQLQNKYSILIYRYLFHFIVVKLLRAESHVNMNSCLS